MVKPRPIDAFNYNDITNWLGERLVASGRDAVVAVGELTRDDASFGAAVADADGKSYAVKVQLAPNGRNYPKSMKCTCAIGGYCRHVAAVLLAELESRGQPLQRVSPAVLDWIETWRKTAAKPAAPRQSAHRLFWVLEWSAPLQACRLACYKARLGADGGPEAPLSRSRERWQNFEAVLDKSFQYLTVADLEILRLYVAQGTPLRYAETLPLAGGQIGEILRRLLATGRLLADDGKHMVRLAAGAARVGEIDWQLDESGQMRATATATPAATWILATTPAHYVDLAQRELGLLSFAVPDDVVAHILAAPPLAATDIEVAASALAELAPTLPPPKVPSVRVIDAMPTPVLELKTLKALAVSGFHLYSGSWDEDFDCAVPGFRYDGVRVPVGDERRFVKTERGETVQINHSFGAELGWLGKLRACGLIPVPTNALRLASGAVPPHLHALPDPEGWSDFMLETLPSLRDAGWEIDMPKDFRHHVLGVDAWEAEVAESENGWFDLDVGITVAGRRLPLAPLLVALFQHDRRWLDVAELEKIPGKQKIDLLAPEGQRIRVDAARLKPLARVLLDLFNGMPKGKLRVSRFDAPRLAALVDMGRWQFKGMDSVVAMAHRLTAAAGVQPVAPPVAFALEMRPYQKTGLAWLQYLRAHDLAGILADDMGLGKTAQALAHLLLEKEAGRLDRPALVVLPTSLVFNWKREAERFAPTLAVLSLHGPARKERFAAIPDNDVCLTTYPLLWRDAEELGKYDYHLLILDEAQTVKNAASQAAGVVRQIRARHRLCLTGTPLENHLGELWSQFDFLLPGFLGDAKHFAKAWRTPIEKHGDKGRRQLLARRLKPFILRRKKEDVATELPPKTIIVRTVELETGQRDLYETVRAAMDARVRDEIATKGFNRSQIVILDALLKLRQVCCDPRLVKSVAAKKVKERAKLDLLMEMLPELVEEGRRILVFSQFTSMLALIEQELTKEKLGYALLTGDTVDRERQIGRFQDGEVPIFLISLKAGGIGLNLTAADTVIHYDPWWNPAVENQATDRAHRLGQTKNVFVYKLVVAGSIEEKILVLQEKKADLAAGILSEDAEGTAKFSADELQALLEPLT